MDRTEAARLMGVPPGAGVAEVKRRFRAIAARHHPDRRPGDAENAARFARLSEAYEVLLETPTVAAPASPTLVRLRVTGERAWRGGALELAVEGHRLRVRLPPGVLPGDVVRGSLDGAEVDVEIESVDHWPYRRQGRDLRAQLLVSAHDVVAAAEVDVPTPWGDVRLRLPRGGATLRLRGRGLRRRGEPEGDLLLEVVPELPPADPIVLAALRPHRRPPRIG